MNKNPRVAVLYPIPFGEGGIFGGGERYAIELAAALAKKTRSRLITFGDRSQEQSFRGIDIQIHKPLQYIHQARQNPLAFGYLTGLMDVDVIHCVSWNTFITDLAVLFAKAARKKVFITDVGGGGSFSLVHWLPIAKLVNGFLLISKAAGGQFEEFRKKCRFIYGGVDTEKYKPNGSEREGVLFVGRLLPHKGINYLIEGMSCETQLTIVGRPYDPQYFDLLQRLSKGKKVTFLTGATDDEVLLNYQKSVVAVLPSVMKTIYGDYAPMPELLGFAALEAMACATPVICTKVGGLPEVVEDGQNGYLVEPNSAAAISEKIRTLLADTQLAKTMGDHARLRVLSQFTWDRVADECLHAYTEM